LVELIVIFLLVLANGVFAGSEIAVVALQRTRIQALAEEGSRSARAVLALRNEPERFLATVQVGITVVGATAAAFGGASIAARIAPMLARIGFIGEHADGVALAVVVAGVSYLSIVVGELVPKSLALRDAERYALIIGRPLLALSWLVTPVVWLLSSSANILLRPFGDRTTFTETRHSAEELRQLVEEAAEAGTIPPDVSGIASRALELPQLTAADVMVPREDVVLVPRHASAEELRRIVLSHMYTRLPVYEDRVDNIVGYIGVKDVLPRAWAQKPVLVDPIMRPPYFVPESVGAVELLEAMRSRHLPLAIVVDEQGGASGIVTLEDLVEELVGEIFSEHVSHAPQPITREVDGSALVSGTAPIRTVNRDLGIELPDEGAFTTIAGLCLARAGRVPNVGQSLTISPEITLEIVDASPQRIRTVRIRAKAGARTHRPDDDA
jgi:putative hemolysin